MGRLSPSSFGLEPTRLLVLRSDEAKAALRPLCWNQPQITTASEDDKFVGKGDSTR